MKYSAIPLESVHISDVAKLENICFSSPWSEKSLQMLLSENSIAFVCVVDEMIVGYCGAISVLDEADITSVAVHPEFRRCGIASVLLDALFCKSETKGIKTLTLEVREGNYGALVLYRKYDFVPVGRIKNYYKNPNEDALIMRKCLK